jgi:hypothetical protein
VLLAGLAALGSFGDGAAQADVTTLDLQPGQSFAGDVPAGETIRLSVRLAEAAKLRLEFTLQAPAVGLFIPANFQRLSVTGPDGTPVAIDGIYTQGTRYYPKTRRSTFRINGWPAPAPGTYTIAVTHRTTVATRCKGRVAAKRQLITKFTGDETLRDVSVPVAPDDRVRMSVKKTSGTAPFVAGYTAPGVSQFEPKQKRTRNGSSTPLLPAWDFGRAEFRVGYQEPSQSVGTFKGTVVIKPYLYRPGTGISAMYIANPPGVPLSVRDPDAAYEATFAQDGVGMAFDGTNVLVTGGSAGQIYGRVIGDDLVDPNPFTPSAVLLISGGANSDLSAGEVFSGHRTIHSNGAYYVAGSSSSGRSAALGKFNTSLTRTGFSAVVEGPTETTRDLFLVSDGFTIAVGIPSKNTSGIGIHNIHQFDAAQLASVGTPLTIGSASWPQSAGSSAVWREDQAVFEFWTAETTSYGVPSNLHHTLYSSAWLPRVADEKPVADPTKVQAFPTAVVVDPATGASIVHWIQLDQGVGNLGLLKRAIFDSVGVLVPDSVTTLGSTLRNRPCAVLRQDFLYLAVEGASNGSVARYRLLR